MAVDSSLQVEVCFEQEQPRKLHFDQDVVTIGRSDEADIQLGRHTVSRLHAKFLREPDNQWRLVDLGSRGGTKVNGRSIKDTYLEPNDEIAISRFRIKLLDPTAEPDTGTSEVSSLAIDDSAPVNISLYSQMTPPHIDTGHIISLSDFGKQLVELESEADRMNALCSVVTGSVVPARWAVVLRYDDEDPARPPIQMISASESHSTDQDMYISRSLIQTMRESRSPVLGSTAKDMGGAGPAAQVGAGTGTVEMTLVSNAPATAAVACPLLEDEGSLDCLYVSLPLSYGTSEWFALVVLAVKQYQQAEAIWKVRESAEAQAAMDRDLANARKIQTSLLPRDLNNPKLDIAWSYEPCESIGGDYVDAVPMDDGRVLLAVADVTGHGLPAALTTLSLHSIVHIALRAGMSLYDTMITINEHMCEFLPESQFVTMTCIVLDTETGKLECINAGHGATVLVHPDGSTRILQAAEHMVLGVMKMDVTVQDDQLEPGELLCMTTDGITEMYTEDGTMLGSKGVTRLLSDCYTKATDASCQQQLNTICDRLDEMSGSAPANDDCTIMLVRRKS